MGKGTTLQVLHSNNKTESVVCSDNVKTSMLGILIGLLSKVMLGDCGKKLLLSLSVLAIRLWKGLPDGSRMNEQLPG